VDPNNGTLAARHIKLPNVPTKAFTVGAASLAPTTAPVTFNFGADKVGTGAFAETIIGRSFTERTEDFEPAEIEGLAFTTSGGAGVQQSMITTQAYTAPLVLPRLYFRHTNPVTLLLVGAQAPLTDHPGRRLHLLAVPSQDPEAPPPDPDAGTLPLLDAGAPDAKSDG
jgi:hypothetical protein